MSQRRCERLWQVEASQDGRLSPADRASFDRHAEGCEACRAELAAERRLLEEMDALPRAERSPLESMRARHALLRAADERLVGGAAAPSPWGARAARLGLAFAAAAGLFLVWSHVQAPSAPPVATATFEVTEQGTSEWSEERQGDTTQVIFRDGKAGFHVEHLEGPARFVMALPDGRLEVHGTRFVVDVAGGRTREVTVSEGVVALELQGFSGLLRAGDRWPPAEVAAPTPVPEPPPLAAPTPSAPTAVRPSAPPVSASVPSGTGAEGATALPPSPTAGERFSLAMGAFSAGDYGLADRLFAEFVRDFPRDGRAEDAMFLRADARARRGDAAGAAAAARDYLRVFPRGLRRPEAERLALGK